MDNPAGFLFRVGQSGSRRPRSGYLQRLLLAWPADRTTWGPDSKTVVFRPLDGGGPVELHDGDQVSLGGGEWPVSGPNVGGFRWVAEPAPACRTGDEAWMVGESAEVVPG